jgi:soluble P-type ATPase
MIAVDIPGHGRLELAHLVLDFSGTLSEDGRILPGVLERIERLAASLEVHVLTADTHGRARRELAGARCTLHVLEGADHTLQKQSYVERLGAGGVVAIGNGNNDTGMLQTAGLAIAVCLAEGCSGEALQAATVVTTSPLHALDLLLQPKRLVATLRR